jgi:sulfide dehydrogenase cytochrome subunit
LDKRNAFITVITTAAWLCLAGTVLADTADIVKTCDSCHGADNLGAESGLPAIAGLSEFYHADQLYFYRDGERPCADAPDASGNMTNMCAQTADLSDDEIDAVAAHYAALPFVAAQQEFDAALVAAGQQIHERDCEVCHTDGGSNVEDDASILAGQWMGYLEATFAEYASGEREQPEPMKKKLSALSGDDIKALLHYYASQQ